MNIKRISLGTGKFHIYRSEIVNSTFGEKEVEFSFTIHEIEKRFRICYFTVDVKRFRCYSYIAKRGLFFFAHITKSDKKNTLWDGLDRI